MSANITFEKAKFSHKDTIFSWLSEPHIIEFWDNSKEHKDDIINFMEGRKTPSSYCDGKVVYWLALYDNEPYAMLMIEQYDHTTPINQVKLDQLSKTGHSYGLDYMIGNPKFFGKGYGASTLSEFIDYFRKHVDNKADRFIIDPEANNPRAKHIYKKAGFNHICDFIMEGNCSGAGKLHNLLVKSFEPEEHL